MSLCYPATFVNGTDTRLYIDSTIYTGVAPGASNWVQFGGETTTKFSVKAKSSDATTKDSYAATMNAPVGYDWSTTGEANWDLTDPGQVLLRAMSINRTLRRVTWRPAGAAVGYYGWIMSRMGR